MANFVIMYSNDAPTPLHLKRLAGAGAGVGVAVADSEEAAVALAGDADAFLGHRYLRQALPHASRLRWVQSTAAGTGHLPGAELRARGIELTRCPIFADTVALHAVALALALVRGLPESLRLQAAGQWGPRPATLPWPETAMIVGLGLVGQAVARRLQPLVSRLIGVRRQPGPGDRLVDEVYDPSTWRQALGRTDLCVLAVSASPGNCHLVDEDVLCAMPPHAVLVNVGQGISVDQDALERTLRAGHLGGAALDVLDPVPVDPGSSFWSTPRLLITPKNAVFTPDRQATLERFIEEQVFRFLSGAPLLHVVRPWPMRGAD
ncbi:MAG: NAD(P)-dependent oxidoreductase [Acidobacteriota bacterium]